MARRKQKLQTYLDDLKAGRVVVSPKHTVEQYLTHWLEDSRRLRVRLTTLNSYRKMLRAYLVPALGHVQLDQLSREHVQALYARLYDDGLAPTSIALAHMVLSSALKEAVKNGLLARNVCETVTLPKGKRYAARGHRLWFFILMAITTGARRGELTALRWVDIDEPSRLLHIRRTVVFVPGHGYVEHEPKTVHGLRSVTLSQRALDGLSEQKLYLDRVRRIAGPAWVENGLVFPNRHGGFMDSSFVLQQFKSILQKQGCQLCIATICAIVRLRCSWQLVSMRKWSRRCLVIVTFVSHWGCTVMSCQICKRRR